MKRLFVLMLTYVVCASTIISCAAPAESVTPTTPQVLHIEISRDIESNKSTLGKLVIGDQILYTLELPDRNNASTGNYLTAGRILAGTYQAHIRTDGDLGWRLELENVPYRTNIQIHVGNSATDTTGCILVGTGRDVDWVSNSKDAMQLLQKEVTKAGKEAKIEVTIHDPPAENWDGTFEMVYRSEVPNSYRGSYLVESTARGKFSFTTKKEEYVDNIMVSGSGTMTGSFRDLDKDDGIEINAVANAKFSVKGSILPDNRFYISFDNFVPEALTLTCTDQDYLKSMYPYGLNASALLCWSNNLPNYWIELKEGTQNPSNDILDMEITITLTKKD